MNKYFFSLFYFLSIPTALIYAQDNNTMEEQVAKYVETNQSRKLLEIPDNQLTELDALFLNALLRTNAHSAIKAYKQILATNASSPYASICNKRLADYSATANITAMPIVADSTKKVFDPAPVIKVQRIEKDSIANGEGSNTVGTMPIQTLNAAKDEYVVQFGAFSSKLSAANFARMLLQKGITTNLVSANIAGKTLNKVISKKSFTNHDAAKEFGKKSTFKFYIVKKP